MYTPIHYVPSTIMLKAPKNQPSRIALEIVKNILAKKGPLETKQIWALSQEVQPTPQELQLDDLGTQRASEIAQLVAPGWVPPAKPPAKESPPPGLSRAALKKHRKEQASLAKAKKQDNGHPVQSISCVDTLHIYTQVLHNSFNILIGI